MSGYPEIMDDVETLLTALYSTGEWDDDHEIILKRWREARGDAGKGGWAWWCGVPGEPLYEIDGLISTREAAIRAGHESEAPGDKFQIIEARCWNDDVQGDENCFFAETRNHEVIVSMGVGCPDSAGV